MLPGATVDSLDFVIKKGAHISVYAVLFVLVHRALRMLQSKPQSNSFWITSFIICLVYAASDEIHQTLIPGRFGTLRDIGFDMLGASIAFLKLYRYI